MYLFRYILSTESWNQGLCLCLVFSSKWVSPSFVNTISAEAHFRPILAFTIKFKPLSLLILASSLSTRSVCSFVTVDVFAGFCFLYPLLFDSTADLFFWGYLFSTGLRMYTHSVVAMHSLHIPSLECLILSFSSTLFQLSRLYSETNAVLVLIFEGRLWDPRLLISFFPFYACWTVFHLKLCQWCPYKSSVLIFVIQKYKNGREYYTNFISRQGLKRFEVDDPTYASSIQTHTQSCGGKNNSFGGLLMSLLTY